MEPIFTIKDKTGREIHLSKKQWSHIRKKHPEVEDLEQLEETIKKPDKLTHYSYDETVGFYYKYVKHRKSPNKYLSVLVKYLNGYGYVVTAYFEDKIK